MKKVWNAPELYTLGVENTKMNFFSSEGDDGVWIDVATGTTPDGKRWIIVNKEGGSF